MHFRQLQFMIAHISTRRDSIEEETMHEANVLVAWSAISDRFSDHGDHLSAEVIEYFHPKRVP